MTSSNGKISTLLAICAGNSPVTGEFPTQRPVTRSFGVFFDLRLNKRLSKQSQGWWFETLSSASWRYCNEIVKLIVLTIHRHQTQLSSPRLLCVCKIVHHNDIAQAMAYQITNNSTVSSTSSSGIKTVPNQSVASLALVSRESVGNRWISIPKPRHAESISMM